MQFFTFPQRYCTLLANQNLAILLGALLMTCRSKSNFSWKQTEISVKLTKSLWLLWEPTTDLGKQGNMIIHLKGARDIRGISPGIFLDSREKGICQLFWQIMNFANNGTWRKSDLFQGSTENTDFCHPSGRPSVLTSYDWESALIHFPFCIYSFHLVFFFFR